MKLTKIHLDTLLRAYAAQVMEIDGELAVMVASEEKGYPGYMYRGEHFERRELLWEKGGGCMSIIPIPNKKNEFLAVMDFYLKESPSQAKLVWGKYDGKWTIKDVLYLPYLHRFDIYEVAGQNVVVLATIADHKEHKEDWSQSGSIYKGILPDDPSQGMEIEKIAGGYFRNHGYTRKETETGTLGYFTSDQGIIALDPKTWTPRQVLDGMISELALLDINGDGVDEMITIEPFHGSTIKIYEWHDGQYTPVYTYPREIDFGHALVVDERNKAFFGGVRRVNADLFMITYEDNQYQLTILDEGGGPANLAIGYRNHQTILVAANHTRNEACVYLLEKEA